MNGNLRLKSTWVGPKWLRAVLHTEKISCAPVYILGERFSIEMAEGQGVGA